MFRLFVISLFVFSGFGFAHEEESLFITHVQVEGRSFSHSCSYYSNTETELTIFFRPDPTDYGTRVFLEYGWAGEDLASHQPFEWSERSESELEPMERGLWTLRLNKVISERSSPIRTKSLNFIFRIEQPGKKPYTVGGVEKTDSYIVSVIPTESASCVNAGSPLPSFQELVVQINRVH